MDVPALAIRSQRSEVAARRVEDVDEVAAFDGIWCCTSALHVQLVAMPETLARLWTALRPGGALDVSFKHGSKKRIHDGRRFADVDEAKATPQVRWYSSPRPPGATAQRT